MGVLDDFLGGDERDEEGEEIRENIDKIREKVQEGRGQGGGRSGGPPEDRAPIQPSELRESGGRGGGREERPREPADDQREPRPPEPAGEQQPRGPPEPQQGGPAQREGRRQEPERVEETERPMEPSPSPDRSTGRSGRGERQSEPAPEPQGPTHDDIPEPPEVEDIDIPDIEKGPLFITVDKFRDALQAISDMRQIAAEMDSYIGSMEGTLEEDRDTQEGIRQILDDAEGNTRELQDIVSP